MKSLVAIPVYNEEPLRRSRHPERVLEHAVDVLVIDDGSADRTPCLLARHKVEVIRHAVNRGYGRSLRDAFLWAETFGYDWVITMDCDEQHEPDAIPLYRSSSVAHRAPTSSAARATSTAIPTVILRRPTAGKINRLITEEINDRLGFNLTDAFCGFKAHSVEALRRVRFSEDGYAFPMQLWGVSRGWAGDHRNSGAA